MHTNAAPLPPDAVSIRPLLKWAGGKTQLLGNILPKIPKKYGRFIEPFFGGGAVGLGDALAGFALAYLMRPVGAIVFGHIGDRYGRRVTMLLSMPSPYSTICPKKLRNARVTAMA